VCWGVLLEFRRLVVVKGWYTYCMVQPHMTHPPGVMAAPESGGRGIVSQLGLLAR
jgi:hypothetical protein